MRSSDVKTGRRNFLKRVAVGGIVTAGTLGTLKAHAVWAHESQPDGRTGARGQRRRGKPGRGYGPLQRMRDQNGDEVLALPSGFRYVTFGKTGEMMSDGFPTPRNHDGMTCFEMSPGKIRLIRNHEVRNAAGDFTSGVLGPEATRYDVNGNGGCVTLDFDMRQMQLARSFISLNGTIANCSGGPAYRDAGWLTCEETTSGVAQGFAKPHGYSFLVSKDSDHPEPSRALTAMGRFSKEAAVADGESGIVYQTEDAENHSGFYRFLPSDPANLSAGGVLQMLAIRGRPNYSAIANQTVGVEFPVDWVTIDTPDPAVISAATSCFAQGFGKGGARFNRLEGVFRGDDGAMYFVSTSGGDAGYGQLWRYAPGPAGGTLVLVYESPAGAVLDSPDNFCITPSGAVLFCEDDTHNNADTHPLAPDFGNVDRLIGLAPNGEPFEFAVNVHNRTEFAGACFSPDGEILFVNIFGNGAPASGMTCAIAGPWASGPL